MIEATPRYFSSLVITGSFKMAEILEARALSTPKEKGRFNLWSLIFWPEIAQNLSRAVHNDSDLNL